MAAVSDQKHHLNKLFPKGNKQLRRRLSQPGSKSVQPARTGARMNRQTLRDACHQMIGTIDTAGDGKQTARDARNHITGYYDPRANLTRDARFHTVGHGKLLASLIR
jgi:hypothetical protein